MAYEMNPDAVGFGTDGGIYAGIAFGETNAAPTVTSAKTAIGAGYVPLGIFENGFVESPDVSRTKHYGWPKRVFIKETTDEASLTFTCTMLETNENTLPIIYPRYENGMAVLDPGAEGPARSWIFDAEGVRTWVPKARASVDGEVTVETGTPTGYSIRVNAEWVTVTINGTEYSGYGFKFFADQEPEAITTP